MDPLFDKAQTYLHHLCVALPGRSVGSDGNRAAADFFARTAAGFGFEVETPAFACLAWTSSGARLTAGGEAFAVQASPYSPGVRAEAPLTVVDSVEALAAADLAGRIVLLRGEIAREPLLPKNFPFFTVEAHQRLLGLLEAKAPLALVAATARNPEMAGARYPFPLIEDGDFDIPSVYMTDGEGQRLARHAGQMVAVEIQAQRAPAAACNVVARKGGDPARRLVFCAHIDAKAGTPGAIDNAAGVVTLLLLAELLADYAGRLGIEIVAMNGEDDYANPGEQDYLRRNAGRFGEIALGINLDGLGYRAGRTAFSLYGCAPETAAVIEASFSPYPGLAPGEPWFQGDHGLFLMNGRPALALTSERAVELMTQVVHTAQDTPDLVDPARLSEAARALNELARRLGA